VRLLLGCLGHGVERTAVLEPLDLALVEGVCELDVESLAAVGGVDDKSHGLANGELGALEVDLVGGANLVVIGRLGEGERKHTLLLQVGLVLALVSSVLTRSQGLKLTIRAKDRTMMARPPK
jgi:hypothetical protein